MDTKTYQENLLKNWEAVYKKGQLTLWVFLALKDGAKCVDDIKIFIEKYARNFTCEEMSLYRSLRKFYELEIVDFEKQNGRKGPERKYYYLTSLGKDLLKDFLKRNIALFFNEPIKKLISN